MLPEAVSPASTCAKSGRKSPSRSEITSFDLVSWGRTGAGTACPAPELARKFRTIARCKKKTRTKQLDTLGKGSRESVCRSRSNLWPDSINWSNWMPLEELLYQAQLDSDANFRLAV